VENIGQIQATKKPGYDKISCAGEQALPWAQVSGGGIHASQHVQQDYKIADNVVTFHGPLRVREEFKQKSKFLSSYNFEMLLARV
jgi:hypothetical protein